MRSIRAFIAVCALVLAPHIANAQDDDRRNVEVAISGDAEEARLLEETIRETFARRGLVVVRAPASVPRDSVLARVGVAAAVASRRGMRPSLSLSFHYAVPFETSNAIMTSHADLVGIRVMPGIELLHTGGFALEVGVGGGLDVLAVEPRSAVLPS